jgi:hypothetical protein
MLDRAFGDEQREPCQSCDGTGWITPSVAADEDVKCGDCDGTGYEPIIDTREDDAYERHRDSEEWYEGQIGGDNWQEAA